MNLGGKDYQNKHEVPDWPSFVLIPVSSAARRAVGHVRNSYRGFQQDLNCSGLWVEFSDEKSEYTIGNGDADIFLPSGTYRFKSTIISTVLAGLSLVPETGAVLLRDYSADETTCTFSPPGSPAAVSFHVNIDKSARSVLLCRGVNSHVAFGKDKLFKFEVRWMSDGLHGFHGLLPNEAPILGPRQSRVKQYVRGAKIGVGAYASVWSALCVKSGELMAVKKFHFIGGKEDMDSVSREIRNMLQITKSESIPHDHILEILGSATGGSNGNWAEIFLPLKEGNLQALVARSSDAECLALSEMMLRQMLRALDSLKQHNIIHRDVKPENILWDTSVAGSPTDYHFWLCDFGLSNDPKLARTMAGAEPFIAPEVFHRKEQTVKVDIWSLFATYIWARNTDGYRDQCDNLTIPQLHSWIVRISKLQVPEFSKRMTGKMAELNPKKRPSPRTVLAVLDFGEEELWYPDIQDGGDVDTMGDVDDGPAEEEYSPYTGSNSGADIDGNLDRDLPEMPPYEPYSRSQSPWPSFDLWGSHGVEYGDLTNEQYLEQSLISLQGGTQWTLATEQMSASGKGKDVDRADQNDIPNTNLTAPGTAAFSKQGQEERNRGAVTVLEDATEYAEVSLDYPELYTPTPPPGNAVNDQQCDTESVAPTTARDQYSSVPSIFTADEDAMTIASSAPSDAFPSPSTLELLLDELSDLLLHHGDLRPLYQDAVSKMTGDKFELHLRGFFRLFGTNLQAEAENPIQAGAANFVRRSARRVAKRIRQELAEVPKPPEPTQEHVGRGARGRRINEWLENVSAPRSRQVNIGVPEVPDDESDEDDHDDAQVEQLRLAKIKTFLTESQAFVELAKSIRNWLNPNLEKDQGVEVAEIDVKSTHNETEPSVAHGEKTSPPSGMGPAKNGLSTEQGASGTTAEAGKGGRFSDEPAPQPATSTEVDIIAELPLPQSRGTRVLNFINTTVLQATGMKGAHEIFRWALFGEPPPEAGKTRVRWQCSCGRNLRGDFDNKHPEAVADLARRLGSLAKHNTAYQKTSAGPESQDTNSVLGNSPPPTDRSSVRDTDRNLNRSGSPLTPSSKNGERSPSLGDGESNRTGEPYGPHSGKAYFEVCVNVGRHAIRLAEIDVSSVRNDAEFFDKIWNRYKDTRGSGLRRVFMKPRDVHFVYFGVRNRYQAGIYKKPAEIPLPVEVFSERYHYYECPIDVLPPMPSNVFLHYLSCATGRSWFQEIPSAHGESFFFQRLPKKKGSSIFDELHGQGDARFRSAILYGWGIHIIEGPNHGALSLALGMGIMVSFLVSVSVVGVAQTQEQGFGVGQWLLAVVSCLLAALYSKLVED